MWAQRAIDAVIEFRASIKICFWRVEVSRNPVNLGFGQTWAPRGYCDGANRFWVWGAWEVSILKMAK